MYQIINNLPIDLNFSSKSNDQLKQYGTWFNENKNIRLHLLIKYVNSTKNYEKWNADYSKGSLEDLGKWLFENIETEKLSVEEYKSKRATVPEWIEISNWDLTVKTRSILFDIGIYFGEVFIKNYNGLQWKQYFSKIKKDVDHGHICITLKKDSLNPIWLLYILGLGLADKTKNEYDLFNLFKVWENYI